MLRTATPQGSALAFEGKLSVKDGNAPTLKRIGLAEQGAAAFDLTQAWEENQRSAALRQRQSMVFKSAQDLTGEGFVLPRFLMMGFDGITTPRTL
jgi:hypothetical protein